MDLQVAVASVKNYFLIMPQPLLYLGSDKVSMGLEGLESRSLRSKLAAHSAMDVARDRCRSSTTLHALLQACGDRQYLSPRML